MVRVLWCGCEKLDKDLTVGVFYIEEIQVVIFTMFSHRKVLLNWQTVSVYFYYKRFCLLFYFCIINRITISLSYKSYHLLDLGVGYSVILLNSHDMIMQEKSLFC